VRGALPRGAWATAPPDQRLPRAAAMMSAAADHRLPGAAAAMMPAAASNATPANTKVRFFIMVPRGSRDPLSLPPSVVTRE